ncbi:MAG: hypothetical protein E7163_01125 [Firmicutes bacterium]|nr:hypothetical protein [Bacillota bacterium]
MFELIPYVEEIITRKNDIPKNGIVYSDEKPVKSEEYYINQVTILKDEYLDMCIKTILECNPFVKFYEIRYSKGNKVLYFIADSDIDRLKWLHISSNPDFLIHNFNYEVVSQLKRVMDAPFNYNIEDISLLDVYNYCVNNNIGYSEKWDRDSIFAWDFFTSEFTGIKVAINSMHIVIRSVYSDFFNIRYHILGNHLVSYSTDSLDVIKLLKSNEEAIIKNIYVKIKKCPEFMQDDLHKIRASQLNQEQNVNQNKNNRSVLRRVKLK